MAHGKACDQLRDCTEISAVLEGQKRKLSTLEAEISELSSLDGGVERTLDSLLARADRLCRQAGIDLPLAQPSRIPVPECDATTEASPPPSWDDLLAEYDVGDRQVFLDDLLTKEQIEEIHASIDAPIRRAPWDAGDLVVVIGAALVGSLADLVCAPIGNPLSKALESYGMRNPAKHGTHYVYKAFSSFQQSLRGSALASRSPWLQRVTEIRLIHDNLPIDYAGRHHGGEHHRVLSSGHDLLRFFSGIWQIKNGQAIGVRYEDEKAVMEIFSSQAGSSSAYAEQPDWTTAAILYFLHVAADFFTKTSLPIPGTTLLRELPHRELRTLIVQSYQSGVNLRHVVGQAVTPAVTSLVLLLYNMLRYQLPALHEKFIHGEIRPGEAIPGLKLNEMMAVSHALVMGLNLGRVTITGNWFHLNLAESAYCARTLLGLSRKAHAGRCIVAKCERNAIALEEGWKSLESYISRPLDSAEIDWPEHLLTISSLRRAALP